MVRLSIFLYLVSTSKIYFFGGVGDPNLFFFFWGEGVRGEGKRGLV